MHEHREHVKMAKKQIVILCSQIATMFETLFDDDEDSVKHNTEIENILLILNKYHEKNSNIMHEGLCRKNFTII